MKIDPDDLAFPVAVHGTLHTGLTIREHFAAMAMSGILSSPSFDGASHQGCVASAADKAVDAADALIRALNKEPDDVA